MRKYTYQCTHYKSLKLPTKYDCGNSQVSMLLSRNIRAVINFGDMLSVACHQNLKKIQIFRFPCCSTCEDLSIDV